MTVDGQGLVRLIVMLPDRRVGILCARYQGYGCIDLGAYPVCELWPLEGLTYHITPPPGVRRLTLDA